jgi:hypothetical protein
MSLRAKNLERGYRKRRKFEKERRTEAERENMSLKRD